MRLKDKIEAGVFTILAEMEPPKGVDVSAMLSSAKRVKDGIDAFVVPEMSNAVMRMSSLGGAMVLQNEGLPTVFQICCRDRNRLAIQGDLLAAQALGDHHRHGRQWTRSQLWRSSPGPFGERPRPLRIDRDYRTS